MRKFILVASLFLGMASLSGCGNVHAEGQFYVESSSYGYYVDVDFPGGNVRVSRAFSTPSQAEDLANRLNKNLGEDGIWINRGR